MKQLCVVLPCYNEEAVLPETLRRLGALMLQLKAERLIAPSSSVCLVDDGSSDATWALIEAHAQADACILGVKLSHNCGHQNALLAGLLHAPGEVLISLDADLQDDPQAMRDMLAAHAAGAHVVYGVRESRADDAWFKRASAHGFYRLMRSLGVELVFDHADYRLLSRQAVEALRGYGETDPFLRGLVPRLGFATATVRYQRHARFAGQTKYPLRRMLAFALQGVTSFSSAPLRAITVLGLLVSAFSFAATLWVLWVALFSHAAVPGWASTLVPIFFLGGVQLLSLGVIAEYIAKIHIETKRRPRYTVERTL